MYRFNGIAGFNLSLSRIPPHKGLWLSFLPIWGHRCGGKLQPDFSVHAKPLTPVFDQLFQIGELFKGKIGNLAS